MAIRHKVYKVRLSSEEVEVLKSANVQKIARFMRESSLGVVNNRKQQQVYSKIDRDFLLELSRIGGNINQIAKHTNQTGVIYHDDIKSIRKDLDNFSKELWQIHSLLLGRTKERSD